MFSGLPLKFFQILFGFVAFFIFPFTPLQAFDIQTVTSKKGIQAWLVEDHQVPIFSLAVGFSGTDSDPSSKLGLANFTMSMLTEAAGSSPYLEFQEKLDNLAIESSSSAGRDNVVIQIRGLSKFRGETFDVLNKILLLPRFDQTDIERNQRQYQAYFRRQQEDPGNIAAENWNQLLFPDHPYGNPSYGNNQSILGLTAADMKKFVASNFTLENIKIVVVGDITAAELATLLDQTFGSLPSKKPAAPHQQSIPGQAGIFHIPLDVSQTTIVFGQSGFDRKDPDYVTGYLLNEIMGGGGLFSSRLMRKIRVERGLTYGVSTSFFPLDYASVLSGSFATAAKHTDEVIALVRGEWQEMAKNGPTAEELELAKVHMIGSFPLRFESTWSTAASLLSLQMNGFSKEYIMGGRQKLIEGVTLKDAKRVANRLFQPDRLLFTVVGPTPPQSK